jgi:hypothetical protein
MNIRQKIKHRALVLAQILTILVLASRLINADTGTCGVMMITLPFTDVSAANIFFCSVAEAYFSGLTNGTTPTTYSPSDPVTREQMAAFITRTQDSALRRGSRRAAVGQWATPQDASVLKKTIVGSSPQSSCFDGEDIWVPNYSGGNVTRVHASDGRVLGTWTGAAWSTSACSAAGFIYVAGNALATGELGKIYRIDPSLAPGAATVVESNVGVFPRGITYDGLNLWTANKGTGAGLGSITRFNIITGVQTSFGTGFNQPIGIIFDGTNLWVIDYGDSALYRVNPANGTIVETISIGTISSDLATPAFDGSNIWVPVIGGVKIVSITTPARVRATLTTNGLSTGGNFAVAFDGEQMLITNYSGGNSSAVSLWKAASLTPLGFLNVSGTVTGVCSDGLHFWISVNPSSGSDFVMRF